MAPDLDAAFAAGACAAYDDCGHDIPPWWCVTGAEKKAWKAGLVSGYEDIKSLIQRGRPAPRWSAEDLERSYAYIAWLFAEIEETRAWQEKTMAHPNSV